MKTVFAFAALMMFAHTSFAGYLGSGHEEQEAQIALGDCSITLIGDQYVVRGQLEDEDEIGGKRIFYNRSFETRQKAIFAETACETQALFKERGGKVVHEGMMVVGDSIEFVVDKSKVVGKEVLKVGENAMTWIKKHRKDQPAWAKQTFTGQ